MKQRGGIDFKNAQNPVIDFYSGFRKIGQGGCKSKNDQGGRGGGVQIKILYNAGIDFYSGFRKTSQGVGVQFEILKRCAPLISKPGSATAVCYTNSGVEIITNLPTSLSFHLAFYAIFNIKTKLKY